MRNFHDDNVAPNFIFEMKNEKRVGVLLSELKDFVRDYRIVDNNTVAMTTDKKYYYQFLENGNIVEYDIYVPRPEGLPLLRKFEPTSAFSNFIDKD